MDEIFDLKGVREKNNMGYRGISRIELDVHRYQTLHKILASRALTCESKKAARFDKSNRFGQIIVKCG